MHVPYDETIIGAVEKIARVSYGGSTSTRPSGELYHDLLSNGHWSPFEHIGIAGQPKRGNFKGWQQWREVMEDELSK